MFGGGRKKASSDDKPKRGGRANMPLLMDVPGLDNYGEQDDMDDAGDADLEKELADLVGGGRGGDRGGGPIRGRGGSDRPRPY